MALANRGCIGQASSRITDGPTFEKPLTLAAINLKISMTAIQIIAIVSPFVSSVLTAFLTFKFTSRSKGIDILYQNKIPAFKAIAVNVISFKNFCEGRVAYYQANEFHPFYTDSLGVLEHRTNIAKSIEENVAFVSKDSRLVISDLLNQMSGLCNAELAIAGGNSMQPTSEYERMAKLADSAVEVLYQELNLPNP